MTSAADAPAGNGLFIDFIHDPLSPPAAVLELCSEIRLKPGETLMQEGKVCRHFYLVQSGLLRCVMEHEDRDRTLVFAVDGNLITSPYSWYGGFPSTVSFETLEASVVKSITYDDINRLIYEERDTEVMQWLIKHLSKQLLAFEWRNRLLQKPSPKQKYIDFINERPDLANRLKIKHIAQYIGVAPEHLSRIRRSHLFGGK